MVYKSDRDLIDMKLRVVKHRNRDALAIEEAPEDRLEELYTCIRDSGLRVVKSGSRLIVPIDDSPVDTARRIVELARKLGIEVNEINVEGLSEDQIMNMIETRVKELSEARLRNLKESALEIVRDLDLCAVPGVVYAIFGVASVGKTRLCVRLAYELSLEGYHPVFIVSEANWSFGEKNMFKLVRELMPDAEIVEAYTIRDIAMNVFKRLNERLEKSVIVYDSFGATAHAVGESILQREVEKLMELEKLGEEGEIKIEPAQISARVIPLLNIITRSFATYAARTGSIVICIAHESQTVMRRWHGYTVKPSFGERSLHYMYAIYRLWRTERGDRRLTCMVHRVKPELEGRSIQLPKTLLDLETLLKK